MVNLNTIGLALIIFGMFIFAFIELIVQNLIISGMVLVFIILGAFGLMSLGYAIEDD